MRPFTQAFNDAIRATDREIRGYLEFNNDSTKRMYGDDGLIQFVVHQPIMSDQRYEVGSCNSFYCEASFFNSGIPAGVSLANSYFSANVGVKMMQTDNSGYATVIQPQELSGTLQELPITIDNVGHIVSGGTVKIDLGNIHGWTCTGTWTPGVGLIAPITESPIYTIIIASDGNDGWTFSAVSTSHPGTYIVNTFNVSATAEVDPYEYKNLGWFYVSEISRGKETTSVVAYDVINKMAGKYVPTVTKSASGFLVKDILNDIIDQSGIQNGTHFTGSTFNFYVPEIVDATMRETWGWLMACAYSSTRPGADSYGSQQSLGNAAMRSYSQAVSDQSLYNYPTITDNEIYMDGLEVGDTFTISSFTTGTQENPIVKGSGVGINSPNPYITDAQATDIYNGMNGVSYTPMTLHWRGDPCVSPFDLLTISTDGNTYTLLTMNLVSTFNGGFEQTIESFGDSEAYYEMSYSPTEAKIQTNNTLIKDIAQAIETARGGVISQILDADGTWSELTIANNQDLSQATSVWRFNINGLAHSTAYQGGTYTFALDDQGRIVATLIQTGILQDALGKNSWNLDTGAFTITDGSINITTNNNSQDIIVFNGNQRTMSLTPSMIKFISVTAGHGNESAEYSASLGLRMYTDDGAVAQLTPSGAMLLGGAGMGANGSLTIRDSSTVTRGLLDINGLTFYNSSGTVTAQYSATASASAFSQVSVGTAWTKVRTLTCTQKGFYAVMAELLYNNSAPRGVMIVVRGSSSATTFYQIAVNENYSNMVGSGTMAGIETSCVVELAVGYVVEMYAKTASTANNTCYLRMHQIA